VQKWAKGNENNDNKDDKHQRKTYLQEVVQEADISTWEASSSKFEWMLDKLRTTTGKKILVFSSW